MNTLSIKSKGLDYKKLEKYCLFLNGVHKYGYKVDKSQVSIDNVRYYKKLSVNFLIKP